MGRRDTWVLIATIVGSSMVFIDGSVVALALPRIEREFHANAVGVAWIVEIYTLVLGACMLLGGALGDRYGRRRIFLIGTFVFTAGSIACALSWSLPAMLAARVLQGIGGMMLAPASLAILGSSFSGEARGRAIAAWSAFGALTSSLGPMLGGTFIDALGWRSVFYINVPLAVVVLIAATTCVRESRDDNAPRDLDWIGAALATAALGSATYALLESAIVWLVAAAIFGVAFVIREMRATAPLIPPGIFSSRSLVAINIATLFLYGALGAVFYELPFVLIQARGYTALQSALATLPLMIGLVSLSRVGAGLAERIGARAVLTVGPSVVACGFLVLAFLQHHHTYVTTYLPGLIVVGIGLGLTVAPLTTTAMTSAPAEHVGVASGINSAVSRIAGLLAIAAFAAVIAHAYDASFDRHLVAMHATSSQRAIAASQRSRLAGARFSDPQLRDASNAAFVDGFVAVAFGCALLAALAATVNAIGIRNEKLRGSQPQVA